MRNTETTKPTERLSVIYGNDGGSDRDNNIRGDCIRDNRKAYEMMNFVRSKFRHILCCVALLYMFELGWYAKAFVAEQSIEQSVSHQSDADAVRNLHNAIVSIAQRSRNSEKPQEHDH